MGIHGDFFNSIRDVQRWGRCGSERDLKGVAGPAVAALDISTFGCTRWAKRLTRWATFSGATTNKPCIDTILWRLTRLHGWGLKVLVVVDG